MRPIHAGEKADDRAGYSDGNARGLDDEQEFNHHPHDGIAPASASGVQSSAGLVADQHQSDRRSGSGQPSELGRGGERYPPSDRPPFDGVEMPTDDDGVDKGATKAVGTVETARTMDPRRHSTGVGVKLGTFDGSTCLETFLDSVSTLARLVRSAMALTADSVKNFATYFHWSDEDKLFYLQAYPRGPADQPAVESHS